MIIDAIIPAAGVGRRFNDKIKKQYYEINGKPILYYTLKNLYLSYNFNSFIIGCNLDDNEFILSILNMVGLKNYKLVKGGSERFYTVYNCAISSSAEYVLIHDAVRPFINSDIVDRLLKRLKDFDAVICGLKVRDTLKIVENNKIVKTVDRERYFLAHTPQVFKREKLIKGFENIFEKNIFVTDEAQVMEEIGESVGIVESDIRNLKITYSDDISFIDKFL